MANNLMRVASSLVSQPSLFAYGKHGKIRLACETRLKFHPELFPGVLYGLYVITIDLYVGAKKYP